MLYRAYCCEDGDSRVDLSNEVVINCKPFSGVTAAARRWLARKIAASFFFLVAL